MRRLKSCLVSTAVQHSKVRDADTFWLSCHAIVYALSTRLIEFPYARTTIQHSIAPDACIFKSSDHSIAYAFGTGLIKLICRPITYSFSSCLHQRSELLSIRRCNLFHADRLR